jgi:hypothetical protein
LSRRLMNTSHIEYFSSRQSRGAPALIIFIAQKSA